jgi:hypothetical protein
MLPAVGRQGASIHRPLPLGRFRANGRAERLDPTLTKEEEEEEEVVVMVVVGEDEALRALFGPLCSLPSPSASSPALPIATSNDNQDDEEASLAALFDSFARIDDAGDESPPSLWDADEERRQAGIGERGTEASRPASLDVPSDVEDAGARDFAGGS